MSKSAYTIQIKLFQPLKKSQLKPGISEWLSSLNIKEAICYNSHSFGKCTSICRNSNTNIIAPENTYLNTYRHYKVYVIVKFRLEAWTLSKMQNYLQATEDREVNESNENLNSYLPTAYLSTTTLTLLCYQYMAGWCPSPTPTNACWNYISKNITPLSAC